MEGEGKHTYLLPMYFESDCIHKFGDGTKIRIRVLISTGKQQFDVLASYGNAR